MGEPRAFDRDAHLAHAVPGCPWCVAPSPDAPGPTPLYDEIERTLIGMIRTSYPMPRNAEEKGWNEAIHAARKKVREYAAQSKEPTP